MSLFDIENRRAIIDRRALTDRIAGVRPGKKQSSEVSAILREALEAGRAEIGRRLTEEPGHGRAAAQATAFLHDQIVRLAYDYVTERMVGAPIGGEVALVGLGGTGRGEMAPYSDFDLMVLTAKAPSAEVNAAAEAILHLLWDLKLKVGHSVRSTSELIALAKKDMTIRTALLEGRWLWGDDEIVRRRDAALPQGGGRRQRGRVRCRQARRARRSATSAWATAATSSSPTSRTARAGLRDLHTLYWIGKYVHGVERPADLVGAGLLTPAEFRRFERAERFFWSVRCHLHIARRPRRGAAELRISAAHRARSCITPTGRGNPRSSASCNSISCNAKTVGDLTGVFLAQLDEQLGKQGFRFALPTLRRRPRRSAGSCSTAAGCRSRPTISSADDPVRLLELFALADARAARNPPAGDARRDPRCGS